MLEIRIRGFQSLSNITSSFRVGIPSLLRAQPSRNLNSHRIRQASNLAANNLAEDELLKNIPKGIIDSPGLKGLDSASSYEAWKHSHDPNKKTIVVLGTGWSSVKLVKDISLEHYNVVIISPRNYFLFTPLLPACTTGTLEHHSIQMPIRNVVRKDKSGSTPLYLESKAKEVDYKNNVVKFWAGSREMEIEYDHVVVGVGAKSSTFGIPGVGEHARFLKEADDARKIRKDIINHIERAVLKPPGETRKNLLHTVIVGGGPTGVEFAAELKDFFQQDLVKTLPKIVDDIKITLVEALPTILPTFKQKSQIYGMDTLRKQHINVMTNTAVEKVTDDIIYAQVKDKDGSKVSTEIPYGLLIWATGTTSRDLTRALIDSIPEQKEASKKGLVVDNHLLVKGTENVWALGDCTTTQYPATAQVAAQQGTYLAGVLNNMAKTAGMTKSHSDPFDFKYRGSLAYVGGNQAVADLASGKSTVHSIRGKTGYMFLRAAHLRMFQNTKNRMMIVFDWLKSGIFGRDISRS